MRRLALCSVGTRIPSVGYDCTARVWDVASGKEVQRLYDHENGVGCVAFPPGDDGFQRPNRAVVVAAPVRDATVRAGR